MKHILIFIFLIYCTPQYSDECLKSPYYERNIDKHIAAATDIIFGRIIEAKYLKEKPSNISIKIDIHETIKGKASNQIVLKYNLAHLRPRATITTGENYIFFLYGENKIDFCGATENLGPWADSINDLRAASESKNFGYSKYLKAILAYIDAKP